MNERLREAVDARLPIVSATCPDAAFLEEVVGGALPEAVRVETRPSRQKSGWLEEGGVMWYSGEHGNPSSWANLWKHLHQTGSTLVLVNCKPPPIATDAGAVKPVPATLAAVLKDRAGVSLDALLLKALSGSTVKGALELHRLCMSNHGVFDSRSCSAERSRWSETSVLETVPTDQYRYYQPEARLAAWLDTEARLFEAGAPAEIRPRGILFGGTPGTGKTLAAKFIARTLSVPLKMLPVSRVLNKYIGESERLFDLALSEAESCAPCVLLLDEVEKVFRMTGSSAGDQGTTKRIMSRLLWWLQEHDADVLTVMTTNDESTIPPELVRPGRIDLRMDFAPYTRKQAAAFIEGICESRGMPAFPVPDYGQLTPAALTGEMTRHLKQLYLAGDWVPEMAA